MEKVMKKKISLVGLVLGVVLGAIAGLLSGSWIFWLGAGLAIGMFVGAAQARRAARRMLLKASKQSHEQRAGSWS
jgi:uncharacterized membrane protein YoaK (UPF0700 family)